MKNKIPISLIFPVFNEQDVIEKVLTEWRDKVLNYLPSSSEVILDDCSNDNTPNILKKFCKKNNNFKFYHNKRDGFQNAIRRMTKKAKNQYVFMTDSDGQYPVNDFWKLYRELKKKNYDIITGYKKIRDDLLYRKYLSLFFNYFTSFLFFFRFRNLDYNCFYKIVKRDLFLRIDSKVHIMRKRFPSTEFYLICLYLGLKIKRIGIKSLLRKKGTKSNALPLSIILKISIPTFLKILILRLKIKKICKEF